MWKWWELGKGGYFKSQRGRGGRWLWTQVADAHTPQGEDGVGKDGPRGPTAWLGTSPGSPVSWLYDLASSTFSVSRDESYPLQRAVMRIPRVTIDKEPKQGLAAGNPHTSIGSSHYRKQTDGF